MQEFYNEKALEPNTSARAKANRQNALNSTGPKSAAGKKRASQNARRHGLTSRTGWSGPGDKRNDVFMHHCSAVLAPENALEQIQIANLLHARLWDDRFITVEREVLLRRTVTQMMSGGSYTFLNESESVSVLGKLTRHFTHNSRSFEKSVRALMKIRKEAWPPFIERSVLSAEYSEQTAGENESGTRDEAAAPPINRGTLEDLLSDSRLILPDENADDFAELSQELWNSFAPANLLEAFVVTDFILAQWRIQRLNRLVELVFDRTSTSVSGDQCGPGFAFIRDHQSSQALDGLRQYDGALQKHQDNRMRLFRELRSEEKAENGLLAAPATATFPTGMERAQTTPATESESNANQKTAT
jgi:hypothetical protein